MRIVIVVLAAVLLLALVGWISFSNDGARSSINIETGEIRDDTKQVMQSGAELLHKAGDDLQTEANRPTESAPPSAPTPEPLTR